MKRYPLVFSFSDTIPGNGFIARVAVCGRVLLEECDSDDGQDPSSWMYGVQPGGLAAGGRVRSEAFQEFNKTYKTVLFDIAAEAQSFNEFEAQIRAFFEEKNDPTEAEWNDAHADVRQRDLTLDGIATQKNPTTPHIDVELMLPEMATPSHNQLGHFSRAA